MSGIIKPSPFPDGAYTRKQPQVIDTVVLDLSPEEARAVHGGRRGCSCSAADLTTLGEKCMAVARQLKAGSWSIYPMSETLLGRPKVAVEFHNWPEMGMCNHKKPIGKERYWWDIRPLPEWMEPNEGERDTTGGHFDPDA